MNKTKYMAIVDAICSLEIFVEREVRCEINLKEAKAERSAAKRRLEEALQLPEPPESSEPST